MNKLITFAVAVLFCAVLVLPPAGAINWTFKDNVVVQGAGGINTTNIITKSPYVDVRAYGALGNNTTDDTAAIQAAHNAAPIGIVFYPTGTYKITDSITVSPYQKVIGASRTGVVINMTDATKYAYKYLSPLVFVGLDSGAYFDSMTINSKYGIKINTNSTQTQGVLFHSVFRNLNMNGLTGDVYAYHPTLMSPLDPNTGTAVVPNINDLIGWGVGINITLGFDTLIENCTFQFYGIANYMEDDDISTIRNNRYHVNARQLHIKATFPFGNNPKIENNEFLAFYRVGGIYLDTIPNAVISKNFFEPVNAAGQILTEVGGYGMSFVFNNINTSSTTTPIISTDPQFDMLFEGNNFYNGGYSGSTFAMPTTSYNSTYSNRATFYNNNQLFNALIDNVPFVRMQPVNKRIFKYNNILGTIQLAADSSFPFEANPVSGNWSLHTTGGGSYVSITGFPTELTDTNLLVKITGTPSTINLNRLRVYWGGVDVSGLVNLYFDNTSLVETKSFTIRRPTSVNPESTLTFLMSDLTENTYVDGIELVPVNYLLGTAAPTDNAYKYVVGERVYNSAPSGGQPKSWVCTVSGSPGTWVSEGNL